MMPYELTHKNEAAGSALQKLNLDPATDTFVIRGAGGTAVAHVKKPDGRMLTARVQANGALQEFTTFEPAKLNVKERRQLEANLYIERDLAQTEIADLLGVSQATVANDLKLMGVTKK